MQHHYVESAGALDRVCLELEPCSTLYVDTEFDSTRDGTRLCLLQVATDSAIYLIDALKIAKLEPLKSAFSRATWVLHAGMQDVPLILRALGIREVPRIFDTQVAYALVSAEANVSLAYLTYILLGIREGKAHQADDWTRRPLSTEQLRYAAKDVLELKRISEQLLERAVSLASGRDDLIYEASLETLTPSPPSPPRLELAMFRNAWQLGPAEQAGLLFLIDWFNRLPRQEREDAPEPKVLFNLASRMPMNKDVLLQLRGVPRGFAQRHHKRILEGLAEAAAAARGADFLAIEPPPYATFEEFEREARLLGFRARVSRKLQVSPEFVLPSRVLRELSSAWAGAETGSDRLAALQNALGGFRKKLLGDHLVELCDEASAPL